jgi:DNA modification methylase
MAEVFREVRRVLRDDGTLWLNLGDSYANGHAGSPSAASTLAGNGHSGGGPKAQSVADVTRRAPDLKPKDLVGIPWRVALALQADGWWLRSDVIWNKPNPMPESITDRPTKAHEYIFLLTKSARYFYDHEAIREPIIENWKAGAAPPMPLNGSHVLTSGRRGNQAKRIYEVAKGANARSVWTITTKPYADAHFATFPPELPSRCIRAGSAAGDLVLDPFSGAATTALVARGLGRRAIGIELNAEYLAISADRLKQLSLLSGVTE